MTSLLQIQQSHIEAIDFLLWALYTIAGIVLLRLTLSIPFFMRHAKAQTLLLSKIAQKSGVPKEETDIIIQVANESLLNMNSKNDVYE